MGGPEKVGHGRPQYYASWEEARRNDPSKGLIDDVAEFGIAAGTQLVNGTNETVKYVTCTGGQMGDGASWSDFGNGCNWPLDNPITRTADVIGKGLLGMLNTASGYQLHKVAPDTFNPPPPTTEGQLADAVLSGINAGFLLAGGAAALGRGSPKGGVSRAGAAEQQPKPASQPPARVSAAVDEGPPAGIAKPQNTKLGPSIDNAIPLEVHGFTRNGAIIDIRHSPAALSEKPVIMTFRNGTKQSAERNPSGQLIVNLPAITRGDCVTVLYDPVGRTLKVMDSTTNGSFVGIGGRYHFVKPSGNITVPLGNKASAVELTIGKSVQTIYIPRPPGIVNKSTQPLTP